ncbi:hypothetical protein AS9A_3203 [Hoyosella subflava DQS3-9A1]|uniref:Uncharacterized protein n=1 Tax=Hoyosella subflava (strain DSM 45089 / JCM 17490 / NBRC 109087 / DQS3-9A1) TaxID=443218 RepID=F6ENH9_HOYSD|nr:hypothetical protein AS9A_3203 [Hoyosella subflava DQS3-9A1]
MSALTTAVAVVVLMVANSDSSDSRHGPGSTASLSRPDSRKVST